LAKVLVLFSGSLASRVAGALVQRHPDVESVQFLHFRSPFAAESEELRDLVRGEWAGTVLRTQSLKREYRRFVEPSADGFSLRHACIQCRSLLIARSARYMERVGADFLVTGERIGRHGLGCEEMDWVAERYGMQGRILRPLCHRAPLGETPLSAWGRLGTPRSLRVVKDGELLHWALDLGLEEVNPLGSCARCKLTQPGFGERVAALFAEEGFTLNGLRLLDFAHYYKIDPGAKVVLAVDEEEKKELQNLFLPADLRVYPSTPHGPMALVRVDENVRSEEERGRVLEVAACIVATHACSGRASFVPIYYRLESDDETLLVNARALGSVEELLVIPGVRGMALLAAEPTPA
jgi:tRNA-uridine 2-sulfurtransferase